MCPWTQSLLFASNQFCGAVASSDFSNVDPFCSCVGAGLASIEFDSRGHVRREFFFRFGSKEYSYMKAGSYPFRAGTSRSFWMLDAVGYSQQFYGGGVSLDKSIFVPTVQSDHSA